MNPDLQADDWRDEERHGLSMTHSKHEGEFRVFADSCTVCIRRSSVLSAFLQVDQERLRLLGLMMDEPSREGWSLADRRAVDMLMWCWKAVNKAGLR